MNLFARAAARHLALLAAITTGLAPAAIAQQQPYDPSVGPMASDGEMLPPSMGVRLTIPFGGPDRRPMAERAEFSLALSANTTGHDLTGRPLPIMQRDMAALRFNHEGLQRLSLSGREFYVVDGKLSLNADGSDSDGEEGGSTWVYWVLGGAAVVAGLSVLMYEELKDICFTETCDDE
ncbi:MAG: hypothetical protein EP335_15450 [Alphaproteobacteria bacterium]|nr:MAG: hypothetical protein EP335_15450 [Alphaproteobacteria bacterium]